MWLMASARMVVPVGHNGSYSSKKVTESLNGDCVWAAHVPRNKAELNKIWQLCDLKYGKVVQTEYDCYCDLK